MADGCPEGFCLGGKGLAVNLLERGIEKFFIINYMSKERSVRITNDSLNSYGTRVLTAGMNVDQYNRNPVLLYMHERGQVIGLVKDLSVDEGEVTGELVFDEATELSRRCKKQWEFGSLKMVSVGIDILETSEAKEHLVEGQTRPTVSRSKLLEVSLVDIGANDDAIVLRRDGKTITMGMDGECCLPLLKNNKNEKEMELKKIALQLGLPETATEADVNARLEELKAAKQENEKLQKEKDALELSGITGVVEKAIAEKKIGSEKKEQFVELGKKIGADELQKTFDAMQVQVKLSHIVGGGSVGSANGGWKKLSDVPADELMKLRADDPAEYKRLYRAEYGMECEL